MSDTFSNYHDYEIRWTPDRIDWLVDGKVGRTLKKEETWNATSKNFEFPQTPARLQLSIWPGGLASNAKGTIDWAGGEMDWDAPDIQNNGYFYASFSDVEIECFNAQSSPGTNNGNSYWYDDIRATNDTIVDGDKKHILASLQGTGTDLDKGKKKDKATKTTTKEDDDKAKETKTTEKEEEEETEPASIPGGGNGSPANDHDKDDDKDTKSNSDSDSGSSSSSGSGSGSSSDSSSSSDGSSDDIEQADTSNCDTSSFNQDCSSGSSSASSSKSEDGGSSSGSRNGASALAIIIAGCALYWL